MPTSTFSRSSRKRSAVESPLDEDKQQHLVQPPTRRARRDILSTEVETLKAELEHERSLRILDVKRFEKIQHRLERQVKFAVEEAQEAKALMDELREESESHIKQLRQARLQAQEELRDVQLQLEEERSIAAVNALEEDPKIGTLQAEIDARKEENESLLRTIQELRNEVKRLQEQRISSSSKENDEPSSSSPPPGSSSPAPLAVLKELNRVRIQLAESERKNRQLRRSSEELQKKAKLLVQEREVARLATSRVEQLEIQAKEQNHLYEQAHAELKSWKEFGISMGKLLATNNNNNQLQLSTDPNLPPEVSVVKRYLTGTTKHSEEVALRNQALTQQLQTSNEKIQSLEGIVRELEQNEATWKKEKQSQEQRIELFENQIHVLKGQENVWKREIDSLRSIVKTFDDIPLAGKESSCTASDATVKGLRASLDAARQELQIVKQGHETMKNNLDKVVQEKASQQHSHNSVLEKFAKLKEAVYAERAKAEKAEARACKAEELAGKGSFNPEATRVLHFQQNPVTEALKQEINVLRRQVETLTGDAKKLAVPATTDVDPNKLHQRLKESFKEQIGRFREGVYLMTGYKIDMIPDSDRPKFKVRSMFAEQEQDHLMFRWPEGTDVQSLDLLDTELAKLLTKSPSYEYVSRFHSIPAFLASTQLSLFEKQTMIG